MLSQKQYAYTHLSKKKLHQQIVFGFWAIVNTKLFFNKEF